MVSTRPSTSKSSSAIIIIIIIIIISSSSSSIIIIISSSCRDDLGLEYSGDLKSAIKHLNHLIMSRPLRILLLQSFITSF